MKLKTIFLMMTIIVCLLIRTPTSGQTPPLTLLADFTLPGQIQSAEWSNTGAYIKIVAQQGTQEISHIYDRTGNAIHMSIPFTQWSWYRNDTFILTYTDGGLQVWSPDFFTLIAVLDENIKPNSGSYYTHSPDETRLITGIYGTYRVWDTSTWEVIKELNFGESTVSYQWSPSGDMLALMTGAGEIFIIDSQTAMLVNSYDTGLTTYWSHLDWNPDGQHIALSSDYEVLVWDVLSDEPPVTAVMPATSDPVWHPSGRYLMAGRDYSRIVIWELATGQTIRVIKNVHIIPPLRGIRWHPTEPYILAISGNWMMGLHEIQVWNWETGEPVSELLPAGLLAASSHWDDSGDYLIFNNDVGDFKIADLTLQTMVVDYQLEQGGFSMMPAVHPQESIFARYENDGHIALYHQWEAIPFETYPITGVVLEPVAWSPNGDALLVTQQDRIQVVGFR